MLKFWLTIKYLFLNRDFLQLNSLLSILGISIGVASLFISMAVFSGYETTVKKTIFDRQGHITLIKKKRTRESEEDHLDSLKKSIQGLKGITPFSYAESLILHNKKISGIMLYGIHPKSFHKVLNFKKRLIKGDFNIEDEPGLSPHESTKGKLSIKKEKTFKALIGKRIAKKNGLQTGDIFKIILPKKSQEKQSFSLPRYVKLKVQGVIDFGQFDYNERALIVKNSFLYEFINKHHLTRGFHIKIKNPENAALFAKKINNKFPFSYQALGWKESEKLLFEVVQVEKSAIFLILCLMLLASGVNVSNTLFVSVTERNRDISLLKILGGQNKFILSVFSLQGLLIGVFGILTGIGLGFIIGEVFIYAQTHWNILPTHIYKLEKIELDFRAKDFFWILLISLLVCWLSTLLPAYRGMKLSPSEGLKYE